MILSEMKRINEAPSKGRYLIYTRKKVYFEFYSEISQVEELVNNEDVLEIHLFDSTKEYRAVKSTSKHSNGSGYIVHVCEENADKDTYEERIRTVSGETIKVINYLSFDSNNMCFVDDYRMVMEG